MATFAKRLITAGNMIAGLSAHTDEVSQRGFTQEVIGQMTALYEKALGLDDKRNALKARSREATSEAEKTMSELEGLCGEARQIVRMDFIEETWPEFGFRKGEYARAQAGKTVGTTEKIKVS